MGTRKLLTVIGVSVAVFVAAAISGLTPRSLPAGAEESPARVISAMGQATVSAKPDIAYVSLGVNTEAPTAAEAQAKNNTAMNAVMAALKQLGISNDDIRTSQFNLYPVYGEEKPVEPHMSPRTQPKVVGYRANNSVTITVRALDRVGEVIDGCVKAGANQIQHVAFALKDEVKYRNQALEEAARASRVKAEAMAKGLGLTITGIKAVQEVSGGPSVGYVMYDRVSAMPSAPAPVAPGSIDVRAEVRVEYMY